MNSYETAVEGAAKYYLEVLVVVRKPIQEVASFVGRFRSETGRFAVSSDYVEALLNSKQYTNARSAVEQVPVTDVQRSLLKEKLAFACISKRGVQFSPATGTGLWSQLYGRLVGQDMDDPQYQWPSSEQLPTSVQKHNEDERYLVGNALHSAWLNGLLAGVVDNPASMQSWIANVRSRGWTGKTASPLASAGYDMGKCFARTGTDLSFELAPNTSARLAMICSSGFTGSPNKLYSSIPTCSPSVENNYYCAACDLDFFAFCVTATARAPVVRPCAANHCPT